MKRSTPVIIGVLLILGVVALGYFAEANSVSNNTTNNSTKFTLLKNPISADQTQSGQAAQSQQSTTTTDTTTNNGNTTQNNTQNQTTTTSTSTT
nr:hypothetical protein [uncultured Methanobacterium sp.]